LIELKISGEVKRLANLIPPKVSLTGTVGEKIVQLVKIIPETEKPFNLVKHSAHKGKDIRYEIQEAEESGKKIYELIVENVRETAGSYRDTITIFTDKTDKMPILIKIAGDIKPSSKGQSGITEQNKAGEKAAAGNPSE